MAKAEAEAEEEAEAADEAEDVAEAVVEAIKIDADRCEAVAVANDDEATD